MSSNGVRATVEEKALLQQVAHDIHAAKANKKLLLNVRKLAKLGGTAKAPHVDPTASAKTVAKSAPAGKKKGGSAAAEPPAPAGPHRKGGGSISITLKPSFDRLTRFPGSAAGRRGDKKQFVLPPTNKRWRMRQAKIEAAAADEDAAPAEAPEGEEAEAAEDADAPAEEQLSALQTTVRGLPGGEAPATRCIVRCRTSLGGGRRKGDAAAQAKLRQAVKDAKDTNAKKKAKRKFQKARKLKTSKATCVVTSQKQAAKLSSELMTLVRKEWQPLLKKDTPAVLAATASVLAPAGGASAPTSPTAPSPGKDAKPAQTNKDGGKKDAGKKEPAPQPKKGGGGNADKGKKKKK